MGKNQPSKGRGFQTGYFCNYTGYDGIAAHDPQQQQSSFSGSYGQKLSDPTGKIASAGQRLALAIVSLCLLMVMTLILIVIDILGHAGTIASLALVFVLALLYVTVIIINVLFNRRH